MEPDGPDATEAEVSARITDLEAQHVVDEDTIARLEQVGIVDRDIIAHLQADGDIDRTTIANLEVALATCRRIGAAIGIIMGTRMLTEEQAFEVLRQTSQHTNRKLRDVADDLLMTGAIG